jgi:hypothetical protein
VSHMVPLGRGYSFVSYILLIDSHCHSLHYEMVKKSDYSIEYSIRILDKRRGYSIPSLLILITVNKH